MAVGDESITAGFGFVRDTGGDDAIERWGAREINRTRDFLAQTKNLILNSTDLNIWPGTRGGTGANNKAGARTNLGISYGTGTGPSGAVEGDIFFKIV